MELKYKIFAPRLDKANLFFNSHKLHKKKFHSFFAKSYFSTESGAFFTEESTLQNLKVNHLSPIPTQIKAHKCKKMIEKICQHDVRCVKNMFEEEVLDINQKIPIPWSKGGKEIPSYFIVMAIYLTACKDRGNEVANYLIDKGADLNVSCAEGHTPLIVATKISNSALIEKITSTGRANIHKKDLYGVNALMEACARLDKKTIVSLLRLGAKIKDADNEGNTPLLYCLKGGLQAIISDFDHRRWENPSYHPTMRMLVRCSDVNAVDKELGQNALFYAIKLGHEYLEKEILSKEVDIHHKDNTGSTVIMEACKNFREKTVESLIQLGANFKEKDVEGNTALLSLFKFDRLATLSDFSVVEKVINLSDVNAVNNEGKNALFFAVERGCVKIVELLLKAGADASAPLDLAQQKLEEKEEHCENLNKISLLFAKKELNVLPKEKFTSLSFFSEIALAIIDNDIKYVKDYIQQGLPVNAYAGFSTLLKLSVREGRVEIVRLFLEAGCDWQQAHRGATIFDNLIYYQQKNQTEIEIYKKIIDHLSPNKDLEDEELLDSFESVTEFLSRLII